MNKRELRGGRVSGGLGGFQVCARGSALVRELIPHLGTCRLVRHSLRFQTCTKPGGVREGALLRFISVLLRLQRICSEEELGFFDSFQKF